MDSGSRPPGRSDEDSRGVRLERGELPSTSAALPSDFLQEVRGRLGVLALLLFVAFAFDPLAFAIRRLSGMPRDPSDEVLFQLVALGAALASLGLRWMARRPAIPPSRLLTIGLVYEVVICFVITLTNTWQIWLTHGLVPDMDWVPAVVIMFPLLVPGPPRRMLVGAAFAGLMSPLAILLLDLSGRIEAGAEQYFDATIRAGFAVLFAYLGARMIYGLGREVVRARELGSYRLGELLGRGGMGEVYRATHRMLARPAAIKLIRPDALGAGEDGQLARRRFRREAEVAASLRSPHTVELYDFGVTGDGTFYFVMELLEGMDLDTLVRRQGALPASRVVFLLRQVCASLAEAHHHGLVHRDIKPANIHVGRQGLQADFVKVLDFGLVKSVSPGRGEDSMATGAGMAPGTPSYMAPEVALGQPYDGRADIYAVGCVAYFLLTGCPVFDAAGVLQVIAKHVGEAPLPPSARTELPIPPEVDRLVLYCLAKRPEERPAGARALADLLGALPVAAWGEAEAGAWWDAHRPALPAGVA